MKALKIEEIPKFINLRVSKFRKGKEILKTDCFASVNVSDISFFTQKFKYLYMKNGCIFEIEDNDSIQKVLNFLNNNLV